MKFSRPTVINIVLAVVVVGALVAVLLVLNPFGWGGTAASDATELTSTVQQGILSKTVTASGSVSPTREFTASFAVAGTISSVQVAVGQSVAAGATLGTLDSAPLENTLASANTSLKNAKSQLADAAASSQASQTSQAKTQVSTAQAAVSDATDALADATLTAPIGGVVVSVGSSVGDTVKAGSPSQQVTPTGASSASTASTSFVTIADTSALTVTANIAEADIAEVTVGQPVTVSFPALSTPAAPAKVTAIAPTATSSNSVVTFATTITLDAVPPGIRLGQTAEVTVTTATSGADALSVPAAAITTANGTSTVKVVAGGKTAAVTVTLGIVGDIGTQVLTGLKAGQTVVIGTASTTQTTTNQRQGRFGTGGTGGFGGGGTRTGGFTRQQ
ncbi:MAG: hypothetical protein JWO10_264 [Microbacteriaceae bacterium]|nr:hypothetical protein [Microbacteriaceae bacterium]